MKSPKISIIIPTYNVRPFISRCLESCINQTLSDIEILIIDDCGSDGAMEIVKAYENIDKRIHIIHNPKNLGTFHARIRGINHAKGEYLLFLDADDYLEKHACEKAYHATQSNTSLAPTTNQDTSPDIVFFGMRFEPFTFTRVSPPIITSELHQDEVLYKVFAHCATPPWHIWAKLYKASHMVATISLLVAHMGENLRLTMAEDVLKSFWLCALAKKSVGIRDKLYIYCDSTSSITRKKDAFTQEKKIADISRVINELERLSLVSALRSNPSFDIAQHKAINILKSVRELEYRYDKPISSHGGGGIKTMLPPYLRACVKSLAFHRKWQTFIRMSVFILSFGKIAL